MKRELLGQARMEQAFEKAALVVEQRQQIGLVRFEEPQYAFLYIVVFNDVESDVLAFEQQLPIGDNHVFHF